MEMTMSALSMMRICFPSGIRSNTTGRTKGGKDPRAIRHLCERGAFSTNEASIPFTVEACARLLP